MSPGREMHEERLQRVPREGRATVNPSYPGLPWALSPQKSHTNRIMHWRSERENGTEKNAQSLKLT